MPIIPTIVVAAAAATMIALGIWQLGRAEEKDALIARYEAAVSSNEYATYPTSGDGEEVWFRPSDIYCGDLYQVEPVAGTAADGRKGWAIRTQCHDYFAQATVTVDLGWSKRADPELEFKQEFLTGIIAPGPRLVADPAAYGLEALAKPDPSELPNNHFAYAMQWFFFALTALVIYALALRRRRPASGG